MKLTGKLKEKVEKARTKEEAREILKEAGIILSDEELDRALRWSLPHKRWEDQGGIGAHLTKWPIHR